MSQRILNDSFWTDNWIEDLDPTEKLVFIYLLTNPLCNIAGMYEIRTRRIAFETGFDKDMIEKILARFEKDKKIIRYNDYICIVNFIKNQSLNPSVIKGIKRIIDSLPHELMALYIETVHSLSHGRKDSLVHLTLLNLTLPNFTSNEDTHFGKKDKSEKSQEEKTDEVLGDAENPENSRFNDFWEKFPKKKNKQKAQEEFVLLTSEEQDLACSEIEKHTKYWKKQQTAEQFIPYPDTWISNKRWQDEIETEAEKQAKSRAKLEAEKAKLEAEKAEQEAKLDQELRDFFTKLPDEKKHEIETEAEKSARKLLPKAREPAIRQMIKSNIRKLTKTAYEQASNP